MGKWSEILLVSAPQTYDGKFSLVMMWSIRVDELWMHLVGIVISSRQPREKREFTYLAVGLCWSILSKSMLKSPSI